MAEGDKTPPLVMTDSCEWNDGVIGEDEKGIAVENIFALLSSQNKFLWGRIRALEEELALSKAAYEKKRRTEEEGIDYIGEKKK